MNFSAISDKTISRTDKNNLEKKMPSLSFTEHKKILWIESLIITAIILAQRFGSIAANVTYICLIVWAMRSPANAIQSLCVSWLVAFLNPGIFPDATGEAALRWMVIFSAFSHVLTFPLKNRGVTIPRSVYFILLFSGVATILSVLKSYAVLVSLLKLAIFTVGSVTILFIFELSNNDIEYLKAWFTMFFLLILTISLPFYFSELGYFRNGTGFQGILSHPQAYGVFIAPMLSLFIGRFIFEGERSMSIILGSIIGSFSLFSTECRTGMLAVLIALSLIFVLKIIRRAKEQILTGQLYRNYINIIGICLILPIIVLNVSIVQKYSDTFLQKRRENISGFREIYENSRGSIIERSMDNFFKNPFTGIGFGVGSEATEFDISSDKFLGIPLSAPTEKGFLLSTVLEEVGIIGAVCFIMFIFSLLKLIFKSDNQLSLLIFFTCLMVNMGEMIFFSFGGIGLYIWLMIGFSMSLRRQ